MPLMIHDAEIIFEDFPRGLTLEARTLTNTSLGLLIFGASPLTLDITPFLSCHDSDRSGI